MRILIIGCLGQVGWELARCMLPLGDVITVDRSQMDLSDLASIDRTLKNIMPDVIVNAAAYTAVDKAEGNEVEASLVNGHAPGVLAAEAKRIGALLIHYSTDYVFDGTKSSPYTEDDTPNPINAYGRSKLMGENAIQAAEGDYIILRLSWVYAARGENFLRTILTLAQTRKEMGVVVDQIGAPTWARLIAGSTAHMIRQSQIERSCGSFQSSTYHLAAANETSWFGFAQAILGQARRLPCLSLELENIVPIPSCEYPTVALRPENSRLVTASLERRFGLKMPDWNQSLVLCMDDLCSSGVWA